MIEQNMPPHGPWWARHPILTGLAIVTATAAVIIIVAVVLR
jgi:hypothetical protein